MQDTNNNASAALVGNLRDVGEGVIQVMFRISPSLDGKIRHAVADLRCSKRALWIAAMESYLGRPSEPTGPGTPAEGQ
jgi:hypothetical protein